MLLNYCVPTLITVPKLNTAIRYWNGVLILMDNYTHNSPWHCEHYYKVDILLQKVTI